MITFAVYNIKGGVGKTATTVNLAYLAALEGFRTLVWDLDPQAAASFYFRVKPKIKGGGGGLIKRKTDIDTVIKGTDYDNLDLIPADFSYRHLDLVLDDSKKPAKRLRKILSEVREDYDYVFLDCAPSISLVSESVFGAADVLLVPTIPTTLSLRTLEQLSRFLRKQGFAPDMLMPFFSMVDRRKHLHRLITEHPPQLECKYLSTEIPYASEVERMGIARAAVHAYAPRSRAATAYEFLWQEIRGRLVETQ